MDYTFTFACNWGRLDIFVTLIDEKFIGSHRHSQLAMRDLKAKWCHGTFCDVSRFKHEIKHMPYARILITLTLWQENELNIIRISESFKHSKRNTTQTHNVLDSILFQLISISLSKSINLIAFFCHEFILTQYRFAYWTWYMHRGCKQLDGVEHNENIDFKWICRVCINNPL